MRYVLEGEWSGYTSAQTRVCHRTVITDPSYLKGLTSIRFTDGTTLDLVVRKCTPREKVLVVNGYTSLIDKCVAKGVDSVDALYAKESQ